MGTVKNIFLQSLLQKGGEKMNLEKVKRIEKQIDYVFKNKRYILVALTRRSYAIEHSKEQYNQRLEFLGDSVLGLTIAEELYKRFPDIPEGQLTKIKASVVCEKSLAVVANRMNISRCLYIGRGELHLGIQGLDSTTSDTLEAIFGAVYLDGGFAEAKRVVLRLMSGQVRESVLHINEADTKSALQELVQKKSKIDLEYVLISEEGPEHNKHFVTKVVHKGKILGIGEGKTKKMSEKQAAANAIRDHGYEYR